MVAEKSSNSIKFTARKASPFWSGATRAGAAGAGGRAGLSHRTYPRRRLLDRRTTPPRDQFPPTANTWRAPRTYIVPPASAGVAINGSPMSLAASRSKRAPARTTKTTPSSPAR